MRIQFAQANNTTKTSSAVILKLETKAGTVSYGESCPRTYVTGESPESVHKNLKSIEGELYRRSFTALQDIREYVCQQLPQRIGMAAICALETALLDAWARETGTNLVEALKGNIRGAYRYTGVIPFGDIEKLRPLLTQFRFEEIKMKVGPDMEKNIFRLEQIREIYGPDIPIRVDANCSWNFAESMQQTTQLIAQKVTCIEQPFPPAKDWEMKQLTANFGEKIEIMADESLTDFSSALHLIKENACNCFNLKISKNGGILNTLRIYELAQQHGINCRLGAHFGETSILTAAGMVLASVAGALKSMEGGLGTYLLEKDICKTPLMIDRDAQITGKQLQTCSEAGYLELYGNFIIQAQVLSIFSRTKFYQKRF
ncbi:MAG: dipeptide epimerase [Saprospiraceae bacterium]|nr:MAG: dipeptide epimerase [Saprospiraceae bacterium]